MRSVFCAMAVITAIPVGSACAADMPLKAPPVPYIAAYNWTGFYVGGEVGGGWASQTSTVLTQTSPTSAFPPGFVAAPTDPSGVLGGFNAGANYQINHFVLGIDGDYTWADLKGTSSDLSPVAGSGDVSDHDVHLNWLATVTGRVGYVVNNNWLLFAKGGGAWAAWSSNTSTFSATGKLLNTSTGSDTRDGWTVGGGVEWGFAAHWSAKLEYDYVKFDTATVTETEVSATTGAVGFPTRSVTSDLNILKAGVAYHF